MMLDLFPSNSKHDDVMKFLTCSMIAACVTLVGCKPKEHTTTSPASQPAPAPPAGAIMVTASQPSAYFEEVLKHLDVGGKSLHFEDHSGRREFWLGLANLAFKNIDPEDLDLPQGMNPETLMDAWGFGAEVASGCSLSRDGDQWLLRHYSHNPNGLPPLFNICGASRTFDMASSLSAETDVALEITLDATSLPDMMRDIAKMAGETKDLDQGLAQELPIGMDVEALLRQTKLHLLVGIELETTEIGEMPVTPKHWVLKLTLGKDLRDKCEPFLGQVLGVSGDIANRKGWQIPVPQMPGLLEEPPVVVLDGDDAIMVVSSSGYLEALGSNGATLGSDPVYQSATNHFPSAGNLQFYLSPMLATTVRKWADVGAMMEQEAKPMVEILKQITPDKPWSLCVATSDTGVQTLMEMPFALDSNAVTTMTMLSATSTLFIGARSWKGGSDRSACIMNQRNIQQAIRSHQNMHNIENGEPIDWDKIFGPDGYIKKPSCPEGGIYSFAKAYPEIDTLACTCSLAATKSHKPDNHVGW